MDILNSRNCNNLCAPPQPPCCLPACSIPCPVICCTPPVSYPCMPYVPRVQCKIACRPPTPKPTKTVVCLLCEILTPVSSIIFSWIEILYVHIVTTQKIYQHVFIEHIYIVYTEFVYTVLVWSCDKIKFICNRYYEISQNISYHYFLKQFFHCILVPSK